MTEYEFTLADRLQKIRSMDEAFDLRGKAYISFSGGKDSCALSALMDMALPGNRIPRVFINTGIEYKAVVDFVRELKKGDERLSFIAPSKNIKETLEEFGYPFKSKEHSLYLSVYQKSGEGKTVSRYLNRPEVRFACPKKLRYQFTSEFSLNVSDKCCLKLKKEPVEKWAQSNGKTTAITGIRKGEGGVRRTVGGCAVFFDKDCKALRKFHPLLLVSDGFVDEFIERNDIKLCPLYYPPYNFKRTGCKGCPFNPDLQRQLDLMAVYFPSERKQCEFIWDKVYAEYRRTGYRLEPSLFDL